MTPFARLLACVLAFGTLAGSLAAADPKPGEKPDNKEKEKVVGKWKVVSSSAKTDDLDNMKKLGLALVWVFKDDGSFALEVVATDDKEATKTLVATINKGDAMPSGKYALGGDGKVSFTDVKGGGKKEMTTTVKIDKDELTMKDPDGTTMKCERVK